MSENERLICAIMAGDTDDVKRLLKNNVDQNFKYNGYSPLEIAIKYGYVDIVSILFEHGSNINILNKEELIKIVEYALLSGCGITKILVKYCSQQLKTSKKLLFKIFENNPACISSSLDIFAKHNIISKNEHLMYTIMGATMGTRRNNDTTRKLLCNIANPNFILHGYTPLMMAAKYGSAKIIDNLIHRGAYIDIINSEGKNALTYFIEKTGMIVYNLCNKNNLQINSQNGMTILMYICKSFYTCKHTSQTIKLQKKSLDFILERYKPFVSMLPHDINTRDNKGKTALLYLFSEHNFPQILVNPYNSDNPYNQNPSSYAKNSFSYFVKKLLKFNANPNIEDNNGRSVTSIILQGLLNPLTKIRNLCIEYADMMKPYIYKKKVKDFLPKFHILLCILDGKIFSNKYMLPPEICYIIMNISLKCFEDYRCFC